MYRRSANSWRLGGCVPCGGGFQRTFSKGLLEGLVSFHLMRMHDRQTGQAAWLQASRSPFHFHPSGGSTCIAPGAPRATAGPGFPTSAAGGFDILYSVRVIGRACARCCCQWHAAVLASCVCLDSRSKLHALGSEPGLPSAMTRFLEERAVAQDGTKEDARKVRMLLPCVEGAGPGTAAACGYTV